MAEPDELTLEITQLLELDGQYLENVEAWNAERIAEVRSAGRKAGRLMKYKIHTFQTRPNDEGRLTVGVVVAEWPDDEMRERLEERGKMLMEDFWEKLIPKRYGSR